MIHILSWDHCFSLACHFMVLGTGFQMCVSFISWRMRSAASDPYTLHSQSHNWVEWRREVHPWLHSEFAQSGLDETLSRALMFKLLEVPFIYVYSMLYFCHFNFLYSFFCWAWCTLILTHNSILTKATKWDLLKNRKIKQFPQFFMLLISFQHPLRVWTLYVNTSGCF